MLAGLPGCRRSLEAVGGSGSIRVQVARCKAGAERRAGALLRETVREQGKRTDLTSRHDVTKLQASGVTPKQSERWQLEAEVPEEDFEEWLEGAKVSQ